MEPFKRGNTTFKQGQGRYPTGKVIGGQVYFHKSALESMPDDVRNLYYDSVGRLPEGTKFNTLMFEPAKGDKPARIRFDESLDFDTAREPSPGNFISVDSEGNVKTGKTNQVFHHKWMWVNDDYKGFDVNDSYNWSKKWTEKISRPSGFPDKWAKELESAGLNNMPETKGMLGDLPPPQNAQKTQIPGTLPTYKKAADILNAEKPKGKTLDFGAGLGLGAKELGADSFEPFPQKGFKPTFLDAKDIPSNSYERITNFNVLNVVPREMRDGIVMDIGRVLKPGGVAVITTRGKDVMNAMKAGKEGPEPMSVITSKNTYQKGFTPNELVEYLQETLGEGYEVVKTKLGPAGAIIKKLSGPVGVAATIASMPTSAGEVAESVGIMPLGQGSDYVPLGRNQFIDQYSDLENPLLK